MLFWQKKTPSHERAMGWFKQNMVPSQGIIVHTKERVPYPEVTGYFVPTLYDWGEIDLARTCTRWLLAIQLADGAFPAPDGVPYTFDTGQVMRGLCAALEPDRIELVIGDVDEIARCPSDDDVAVDTGVA